MSKRSITVKEIPIETPKNREFETDEGYHVLELCVDYRKGGISMLTGVSSERGYYASVTPVKFYKCGGGKYPVVTMRSVVIDFAGGNGVCQILKSSSRFSQGTLDKLAEAKETEELLDRLVTYLVNAYGIRIKTEQGA